MLGILATQSSGFIIGPIAQLLGWIMNGIFSVLSKFGIESIGACIIIFTILMYLLMLPLTIKQQKFSKLSAIMNPEIQEVQKKYKGKKDQESMTKMNQETQAIYEKYGTSPTGSCLQMAIQLPIMFALYRVIYNVPAYVSSVKEAFLPLTDGIMGISGYADKIQAFVESSAIKNVSLDFSTAATSTDSIIDVLYKLSTDNWASLQNTFSSLGDVITSVEAEISHMNNFLGLNIGNSPSYIVKTSFAEHNYLLLIMAILIPVLAALTQFLNYKLMPQANVGDDGSPMATSMKSMNLMMPLMSAFFCLTFPAGIGLYWIAGAVVRSIQQVVINKYLDRIDMTEVIKKNQEKAAQKRKKKKGITDNEIVNNARINTKSIKDVKNIEYTSDDTDFIKPGSLAQKANMVKKYNEKNNK